MIIFMICNWELKPHETILDPTHQFVLFVDGKSAHNMAKVSNKGGFCFLKQAQIKNYVWDCSTHHQH